MSPDHALPVVGFVGFSGTGKTTLLERVIPILRARGLRVATVKHTHHHFEIDRPGKDSHRHRLAGAQQVMIASKRQWALIGDEDEHRDEPDLGVLLQRLDRERLDLVLVEGFKHEAFPKIELHRTGLNKPLLFEDDDDIVAIAIDDASGLDTAITRLDIDQPHEVADFIVRRFLGSGADQPPPRRK